MAVRRSHTVRNYRPSLAGAGSSGTDDLGVLRESNESTEDTLRRQLLEKDRENDRLQSQIASLQVQLAQRPDLESVQELQREYKSLELLLAGTQRENERSMAEIERGKAREKMLENELAKLAGENWQAKLDIAPATVAAPGTISNRNFFHSRSNTRSAHASPVLAHAQAAPVSASPTAVNDASAPSPQVHQAATLAHIEQVRMLILGMEQRLQTREDKLVKSVERAESEGRRFEELRREVAGR
ncbi:hypothetical protein MKEN_01093300 [Mycena kentingensis (nom. inval.)]|nr:hypothetical protein MKEN_01093300 [Mycena kentingensis (nom. inval.)]